MRADWEDIAFEVHIFLYEINIDVYIYLRYVWCKYTLYLRLHHVR